MVKEARTGKPPAPRPAPVPVSVPAPARQFHGPRSLAALLPPITRPAFRARSPSATRLMTDWIALAGPELGARAWPRRLSGGTLSLAVSGPTALELQHQAIQLIERINTGLGQRIVERLRFIQEDGPQAAPAAAPALPPPEPIQVPGLPPGELRDALGRLGARIAARQG